MKKPIKIIAAIVAFVFVAEQIVYPAPQSALRPPASRVRKEEPSRRILDKQAPPIVMSISDTRHSASFKKGEYFIGKLMRSFGILCEDAFALRYFEEGAADNKIEIWAETEGTEPGERLITTIDLDGDGLPVGLDVKSTDSRGRFSLDLLEFQLQQEKIPAEHGLIERSALNGESSLHIHGIEYLGVQAYIDYLRKTGIQNIVGIKLIGTYRDKVEIFAILKNGKKTVVKKTHTISLNEKGRPEYCPGPRVDFRIALLTLLERQNNPIQIGLDRSDPNIIPLGYVNCHGLRIFLPFLGYREKNVAFFKRYDVKVKERVFEAKEIIDGGFGKAIFKVRLHDNGRPKGMDKNITAAHIADVLKGQGSLTEDGNKRFRSYRRACQGKPSAKVGHRRSAVAPKKRQTRLESPIPTGEPDAVGKKIETKKATAKNANAGLSPKKAAQITDEPIMTLVDKRPEELPVPASKPEKEILDTAPTAPDSSEQLRAIVDGQLSVRERHTSQSRVRYNGEGKKGKRIFAFSAPHKNTGHTRDVYIRNCRTLADGTAVLINTVPEEPRRVEARTRKDSHDLDEPGSFTLPSVISFYNPDTGTFNGYFSSELESRFSRWMDERTKLENPPDPLLFSLKDRRIFGKVKDRDVVIDSSEIQNMYNNEYVLIEFRQTSEGNRGVFVYLLDESGRPVALWQEGYLDNDTGDFTWKNKLKMLSLSDAEIERLEGMMWMLGYKPAPVYIGDWLKHLRNNRDGIIIIYYLDFLEGGLRGWDYKTIDAAKEFITNITKLAAEQKGELRIDELIATPESKLSLRQRKEIIIRKRLKTVEGYIHGLSTLLNPYDTEDLLSPHDTEEVTAVRNLIILKALSQAPLSLRITPQFQRKVSEFYLYDAPNEAEIHQAVAEYFASIPLESIPEDIIYGKKSLIATRRYKARIALENGGGSQMLLPSGITQYLRWVSTIPMLSRVGEILLAYKRDQGDKEARGKLVESNHALVIDVAKKRLKACRNLP